MRSIEDEKEIGFEWFESSKYLIQESLARVFERKSRNKDSQNSILGFYDSRERTLSEMPICEGMLGLTLPQLFSVNDEGNVLYSLVGVRKTCRHFYAETQSDLILCITFGQFVSPVLAHARPFRRITLAHQELPGSVRFDRELGIAILIEERDKIRETLAVDYY